jgi:hypothetical protein
MPLGSEMRAALRDGKAAADTRQPPGSNPFTGGQTPRDSVLATMWRRGYQAGNPMPIVDSEEGADNGHRD